MGSAALFGATPPFSKLMLEAVSPFMLAGLLYLGAGVGLGTYRCVMGRTSGTDEASLTAKDIPWLALASLKNRCAERIRCDSRSLH